MPRHHVLAVEGLEVGGHHLDPGLHLPGARVLAPWLLLARGVQNVRRHDGLCMMPTELTAGQWQFAAQPGHNAGEYTLRRSLT